METIQQTLDRLIAKATEELKVEYKAEIKRRFEEDFGTPENPKEFIGLSEYLQT